MNGGDAEVLQALGDLLRGHHSGIGRGLVAVSLDLHTARPADERLAPGKVRHVDEGVVEGREEVANAEEDFILAQDGGQGVLRIRGDGGGGHDWGERIGVEVERDNVAETTSVRQSWARANCW